MHHYFTEANKAFTMSVEDELKFEKADSWWLWSQHSEMLTKSIIIIPAAGSVKKNPGHFVKH